MNGVSRSNEARPGAGVGARFGWLGWLALLGMGCAPRTSAAPSTTEPPVVTARTTAEVPEPPSSNLAQPQLPPPLLQLSDPALTRRLEARGLDVGRTAFGREPRAPAPTNRELLASASYRSLVEVLRGDFAELRSRDPRLGVGMRHGHRMFDPDWLSSEHFRFELVGIVNRIDRRAFAKDTCGEVRFIHRLRYRVDVHGQTLESRLPMTLNVVRWLPADEDGCRAEAERWRLEASAEGLEERWLGRDGPLHELTSRTRLKSIEVNLQSVRWPSTLRPNMAGHAEYLLRVFEPGANGLVPGLLENTPDVARLRKDPALRQRLISWLAAEDVRRAIDEGTVLLPDAFLATRAVSVAPHGLSRLQNRPASAALEGLDLGGFELAGHRTFHSLSGLARRLDTLSCPGCHQTRSVAGFHFLGRDDASRRADVIAVPHSAHFGEELLRRGRYLSQLVAGRGSDEFRPSAERAGKGEYGAHCGLEPHGEYGAWDCEPGLECRALGDELVGTCQPQVAGPGDACEVGRMRPHLDGHRDAVRLEPAESCGAGHCEKNAVGFPSGMCSGGCAGLSGSATCGSIALLTEFNTCLAQGVPFESCILDHSRPGALRRCSVDAPCREDYVCARLPSGDSGCIPPYFLFQMRVDGHVFR